MLQNFPFNMKREQFFSVHVCKKVRLRAGSLTSDMDLYQKVSDLEQ